MLKASRSRSVHQVESVLGALETELLNGQPEVNKIAALRWEKRQQNFGKDMMMKIGEVPVPKFGLWICSRFNSFLLLSRVRGLFPGREPFWAGYGNKAWDILAYKVNFLGSASFLGIELLQWFIECRICHWTLQAIGINPDRIFNILSDSKVILSICYWCGLLTSVMLSTRVIVLWWFTKLTYDLHLFSCRLFQRAPVSLATTLKW